MKDRTCLSALFSLPNKCYTLSFAIFGIQYLTRSLQLTPVLFNQVGPFSFSAYTGQQVTGHRSQDTTGQMAN